jgi:hypothetical protein
METSGALTDDEKERRVTSDHAVVQKEKDKEGDHDEEEEEEDDEIGDDDMTWKPSTNTGKNNDVMNMKSTMKKNKSNTDMNSAPPLALT